MRAILCAGACALLVAAGCGSGGGGTGEDSGPAADHGPIDPGPGKDAFVPDDVVDTGDPGTDQGVIPKDAGPDPDLGPGDPGLIDPGTDPDIGQADPGTDTDTGGDVIIPCVTNDDCTGKITDLGPCEFASCSDGNCRKDLFPDDTPCEDGDPCTENGKCKLGTCPGDPVVCSDGETCTSDSCVPGVGCQFVPLDGPCDDGNACTGPDACFEGKCTGQTVDCDDSNDCTTDGCDTTSGCQNVPLVSGDCDDESVCTEGDHCDSGQCVGVAIECGDGNVCTTDWCDAVDGCINDPVPGSKCDDGLDCTEEDECQSDGTCSGAAVDCNDGDPCTDEECVEGSDCVITFNTAPCEDSNPCTLGDVCDEGVCVGTPVVCDTPPANECIDAYKVLVWSSPGTCGTDGKCAYESQEIMCGNGCEAGTCLGDPCEGVDCSTPPDQCLDVGTCEGGSCNYPYADGAACNDENPCTEGDLCDTGVCAGVPVLCNTPPADECVDAVTLKDWGVEGTCLKESGACEYPYDEVPCAGGCVEGICVESLGLLQASFTAGGLLNMESASYAQRCVMPGFVDGVAGSQNWTLSAGFEP